jgi:predicted ABC-type transport system involved in lysophospholipase L1 biosynthesis ATPase subunit
MSAEPRVVVHHLTKVYGPAALPVPALRGVSAAVAAGEFVAVTGPSGCGKSTLLHLLAGLEAPTSGTVLVNGTDLGRLDEDGRTAFRGRHIGVVFQAFNLLDILTAEENVALPLTLAGVPTAAATPRAREALGRVGLSGRAGHRPAELSGGEQQRVAVARALVADPPLILADEPTGNLDATSGRVVFDLLRGLAGGRRTVVMVTHDPAMARRADRIVRLADGAVAADPPEL